MGRHPRSALSPQARKWPFRFLISFNDEESGAAFSLPGQLAQLDLLTTSLTSVAAPEASHTL